MSDQTPTSFTSADSILKVKMLESEAATASSMAHLQTSTPTTSLGGIFSAVSSEGAVPSHPESHPSRRQTVQLGEALGGKRDAIEGAMSADVSNGKADDREKKPEDDSRDGAAVAAKYDSQSASTTSVMPLSSSLNPDSNLSLTSTNPISDSVASVLPNSCSNDVSVLKKSDATLASDQSDSDATISGLNANADGSSKSGSGSIRCNPYSGGRKFAFSFVFVKIEEICYQIQNYFKFL